MSYKGESSSLPPAATEAVGMQGCFFALGGACLSTKGGWLQRGDWVEMWVGWRQGEKCEAGRKHSEAAEGGH